MLDFIFNYLLMMFWINIVKPSINYKNFHSFLSAYPLLMSFMHSFNVLKTNVFFTLSISYLDSLQAYFRFTFKIYDTLDRAVLNQWVTDWVIYFILMRLKISIFFHYLTKNVSISQWWTLRKQKFVLLLFDWLFPQ